MNDKIRNFSIISHVDHGKSTLADRMLELTHTIEGRKMKEQVLDSMELERERGITIKMQPARMMYSPSSSDDREKTEYILNLIDTPGHIDFSYEVSRALKAVEGSLLLVDATQGVQAQTLTTLWDALEAELEIIPVLTKIDSPQARIEEVSKEIMDLIGCRKEDISLTSGKTGEGVEKLLDRIIKEVPPPGVGNDKGFRSLVFDFEYSNHRGVMVYVRVFDGEVRKGETLYLHAGKVSFKASEVGVFSPQRVPVESLKVGEIGYVVTGIKEPNIASVGDTLSYKDRAEDSLSGYRTPQPIVWASLYPEGQDEFVALKQALERLKLSDSSLSFEEESSQALGKGFRCGFLGMLHMEIITERIKREFEVELVVTMPSVEYEVLYPSGTRSRVYASHLFPDDERGIKIFEPWVKLRIITPAEYIGVLLPLLYEHEAVVGSSETVGKDRTSLTVEMPLRELMRNFFDKLKSVSSGFASVSYEIIGMREADVVRMDVLIAEEIMPVFSRVISRRKAYEEAKKTVEKLHSIMPRQLFAAKIQARVQGKILSSKTIPALRKDVTAHLYGGDITRKMKLREKQKEGKKKMKERGKVNVPYEVFLKMTQQEE
ncbi:MAG: translation elongation factor 4 [Candidatus Paceibacterota bacterium]